LHDSAYFEPFVSRNQSEALISARASEKKNKRHKKVTFHLFAQKTPVNGFLPHLERTFPSWT